MGRSKSGASGRLRWRHRDWPSPAAASWDDVLLVHAAESAWTLRCATTTGDWWRVGEGSVALRTRRWPACRVGDEPMGDGRVSR